MSDNFDDDKKKQQLKKDNFDNVITLLILNKSC